MHLENSAIRDKNNIFKYSGNVLLAAAFIVILSIIIEIGCHVFVDNIKNGVLFFIVSSVFYFPFCLLVAISKSAILLNNKGISRMFFHTTFQSINWEEVCLVKIYEISDGYGGRKIAFNFYSNNKHGLLRKIFFSNGLDKFDEFILKIKFYIDLHKISVDDQTMTILK